MIEIVWMTLNANRLCLMKNKTCSVKHHGGGGHIIIIIIIILYSDEDDYIISVLVNDFWTFVFI